MNRCPRCGVATADRHSGACFDCEPQSPEEMRADLDAAGIHSNMEPVEGEPGRARIRIHGEDGRYTLDNRERSRMWVLRQGFAGWGEVLYTTPFADPMLISRMGGTS